MPTSTATARWNRGLKDGEGRYEAGTGAFQGSYSFATRFEDRPGTNPEELLAAAHASCLSMAIASVLGEGGHEPEEIRTRAECRLEVTDDGPRITRMKLVVRGRVPGIDADAFRQAAEAAKEGCPVSGAFRGNLEFVLDADLEA